ncbi:MAG: hypothetical protein ACRCV9_19885 [Burkholderiaceae bacterium]
MDPIYRRTSLGQEKVMQRAVDIPPRLKTLLMLVDGKTAKSKLVQFLPNFGDVEALIEALEVSGYITSMPNFLDTVPMSPAAAAEWAAQEAAAPTGRQDAAGAAPATAAYAPPPPRFEPAPRFEPPPPPAAKRVAAHDEQQLQRFAAQQPAYSTGGNSANLKQAMQLLCDSLSDVGNLDAIDLMVRVERCQTPQELQKYLKAFHQLCVQAMGNKLADDKLRAIQHVLG